VTDTSRAVAATAAGAVLGALAGYLFFTERGLTLRRHLEPALGDVVRELDQVMGTLTKAAGVASESWKLLGEALGDSGSPAGRVSYPRQTSPF